MAGVQEFRPADTASSRRYFSIQAVSPPCPAFASGASALRGRCRSLTASSGSKKSCKPPAGRSRPSANASCARRHRSPKTGFRAFNEIYVGTLPRWSIFDGKTNPVARSNVCPAADPPATPSFHAFSYTKWRRSAHAKLRDGRERRGPRRPGRTIAITSCVGATPAQGNARKGTLRPRRNGAPHGGAGFTWRDTTATQVYTVHDLHPFLADEIVRGALLTPA